jgi:hypothetical protein
MSAIATFSKIPKGSLAGLRTAADRGALAEYLDQHGQVASHYEWSGYILGTLLPYLDEQEISLMKSEHDELSAFLSEKSGGTYFILTNNHRQTYAGKLNPEAFAEQALRDYYNEFNATNEADVGPAMRDGIRALRESLNTVDQDSVVVLSIE